MSTSSAGDVATALERVRHAGMALRARPRAATLDCLAQVLDRWRDPTSKARLSLDLALPEATGFSREVVRAGLVHALQGWTGDALRAVVQRELGGSPRVGDRGCTLAEGFETTSVLLAGALPSPTLLAILAPLALGSPVLVRISSGDPVTARVVASSISEVDPRLGECVEVVQFRAGDLGALDAFLSAECVVASGSDATISAIAARIRPPRRLVAYGHRASVAVLGPGALTSSALPETCQRLALDVALWDQLGCLSPLAVYVIAADCSAIDDLAEGLASALAQAEPRLPRGRIPIAAAAAFARARAEAEVRVAAGRGVGVYGSPRDRWCVVREDTEELREAPLYRFVRIHPLADLAGLSAALGALAPHLAAVAIDGFGADSRSAAQRVAGLGASRVCAPGRMQAPPLGWHHDGQGILTPLCRFSDLEAD
ncbi:MAG TPA: acyl-CoA reductase [Myxococcota bacterium]|nr:acyl-CoA reductase [Myxococcota bacterium]